MQVRIKYTNKEVSGIKSNINDIIGNLKCIKSRCEDRNAELFCTDAFQELLFNMELLRKRTKEISVNIDFYNEIVSTKNIKEYFEKIFENLDKEKEGVEIKRSKFKIFVEKLKERVGDEFIPSQQ